MKKLLALTFIIYILLSSYALGFNNKNHVNNYTSDLSIKHPIDIEEEKCLSSSDIYNYPQCTETAQKAWDKEIKKNLALLKKVMSKEEFIYIDNMNETWEKSVYRETDVINRFISSKDGIIYQTDANNQLLQIKKQYALLLQDLYYNYYKENKEFNY